MRTWPKPPCWAARSTMSQANRNMTAWSAPGMANLENSVMPEDSVTELLTRWRAGDHQALDKLTPLVYAELRRIARRHLRREPAGNSLQTTALVHEAYLKLVDQSRIEWQNRAQFFAVAGELIRRILVDHARARHRDKRGGAVRTLALDEGLHISDK